MSSKDRVLALLQEKQGEYVSGELLAETLGISRNSVWKAINAIRRDGLDVEAVTNRGYCLKMKKDVLFLNGIRSYLSDGIDAELISVYEVIGSTSRLAKEMAMDGAPHGSAVIADSQTGGLAHHSNRFFSPSGGIYLSVILRPDQYPFCAGRTVVAATALSVIETIREKTGLKPVIRGINDIVVNGRKVCGILTESVSDFESGEIQWIVAGIGINYRIRREDMPESLKDTAGSLYGEQDAAVSRNEICAEILDKLLIELPKRTEAEIMNKYLGALEGAS